MMIKSATPSLPPSLPQSYTSKGTLLQGNRLFCEEVLCFDTMPCRRICPYLCTSDQGSLHVFVLLPSVSPLKSLGTPSLTTPFQFSGLCVSGYSTWLGAQARPTRDAWRCAARTREIHIYIYIYI